MSPAPAGLVLLIYYKVQLGDLPQTLPSACNTTSGVIGCAVTRAPNGRSASFTAFMTTAGAAPVPDSPTPLAPSSETPVNVCTCATSMSGISPAIGVR